jgi:hypothetical protein
VSDTDTQIPPDSRMNPSFKHPARLSLGRVTFVGFAGHKRLPKRLQICLFSHLEQLIEDSCRNICMQQGPIVVGFFEHATHFAPASSLQATSRKEPPLTGFVHPSFE